MVYFFFFFLQFFHKLINWFNNLFKDVTEQTLSLTGFLSRLGLASGVSEGIQKLGRLWLEVAAEPEEDPARL